MENTQNNNKKNMWKSQVGYVWAMLGSAVGFANVLSFSAKCYYNGGGAFLVPIFLALIILGIPLLVLEGTIGQHFKLPLVSAYGKVRGNAGKFLGWLSILSVITIGAYYIVITGWAVAYTYFSARGIIASDTAAFFTQTFLKDSGALFNWGNLSINVFLFTIIALIFTWFVTVRNIQTGIERMCSIFMPLLFVLVAIFAIFVCFLPGAKEGFIRYLVPDFSKLLEPKIWLTSFGQIFFSLSLALGIVVGYSRHTDSTVNIPRAMMMVALGDIAVSIISGFAIFGCIGYLSHIQGIPFNEVVTPSTFGMGFVLFPKILHMFHPLASAIVGPLFFFSLFIAGITGVFSIVESIAGNIEVEFSLNRAHAITYTIIGMFTLSTLFCWGNATRLMDALEPMTAGFNMLIGGISEIIIFMYASDIIGNHKVWFSGNNCRTFFYYSLTRIVPGLLGLIFISSVIAEVKEGFGPAMMLRWIWFGGALIIAGILAHKNKTQNS